MLRISGVSKRFGEHLANDGISVELPPGLHAVLGENGAGKTTLLRIIAGEERLDSGSIEYQGKALGRGGPKDALAAGVALVHQHPRLPPDLSFSEAMALGREPLRSGLFLDRRRMLLACTEALREFGGGLDPQAKLSHMSFASRQRVELLRAISSGASLIALDEPTSALSRNEADALYDILSLLDDGKRTIIVVTHRIEEVLERKMDCVVLREGRFQGFVCDGSSGRLSSLMFGEKAQSAENGGERAPVSVDIPPLMVLKSLNIPSLRADDSGLRGFDLEIRPGETCFVLGLSGNGLGSLEDFLSGKAKASSGSFSLDGKELAGRGMDERRRQGMGYVSGDRKHSGLPLVGSALDAILEAERALLRRFPGASEAQMRARAAQLALPLGLTVDWETSAMDLSGGEAQRLIIAREIHAANRFLIACEPFLGLDAQGREAASRALRRAAQRGVAVLVTASGAEEALSMADRILVLYRGRMAFEWSGGPRSGLEERIALAMAGMGESLDEAM